MANFRTSITLRIKDYFRVFNEFQVSSGSLNSVKVTTPSSSMDLEGNAMKSRRKDFENARLKDENVNLNGEVRCNPMLTSSENQL